MLEESPFRSEFHGMSHFRLHIFERSGIICLYLATGTDMRSGISDKYRNIVSHFTIGTTQFRKRNPFGQLYPFIKQYGKTNGRISKSRFLMFSISQG